MTTSNATAERLARAIKFNGTAILEDRDSLQRLLAPGANDAPDDVKVLLALLDTKAVAHLMKWAATDATDKPTFEQMRDHMAEKFVQSGRLSAEAARWGLDTWKQALPSVQQAARPPVVAMTLEPVAEPPPPPPASTSAPRHHLAVSNPTASGAAHGDNPYAPPQSHVEDVIEPRSELSFIENGRMVGAGQGWHWLAEGWHLFARQPLMWLLVLIVFIVVSVLVQVVPFIGPIIGFVLGPVLMAGLMVGAHAVKEGDALTVGHLFAGFKERTGSLMLLALLQLLAIALVGALLWLLFGGGIMALVGQAMTGRPPSMSMMSSMIGLFIVAMLLFAPISIAYYFAPAIVAINGESAWRAYKSALIASVKNILPGIVYSLLVFVAALLASLPVFLGWIVLVPVLMASVYAAYRDIFHEEGALADQSAVEAAPPKRLARTLPPVSKRPVPPVNP